VVGHRRETDAPATERDREDELVARVFVDRRRRVRVEIDGRRSRLATDGLRRGPPFAEGVEPGHAPIVVDPDQNARPRRGRVDRSDDAFEDRNVVGRVVDRRDAGHRRLGLPSRHLGVREGLRLDRVDAHAPEVAAVDQ
jgi:hypothetical protein